MFKHVIKAGGERDRLKYSVYIFSRANQDIRKKYFKSLFLEMVNFIFLRGKVPIPFAHRVFTLLCKKKYKQKS